MTVVLSKMGWVRAAKGHEIDPNSMSYKSGDDLLSYVRGKSDQFALFMNDQGRFYASKVHELPSARGQGEPLTGRFEVMNEASFVDVQLVSEQQQLVVASSAGFGFVVAAKDVIAKAKNGKQVINVPKYAHALPVLVVDDVETQSILVVTSAGKGLCFPVAELPCLTKGKGNKMINIPAAKRDSGEVFVKTWSMINLGEKVSLLCGRRTLHLRPEAIDNMRGHRAKSGVMLPQSMRSVQRIIRK